jgi:hypothetical protein
VNEVLLDFSFQCPSLKIDGQPLAGQSINRLFLYRRKLIVFLPGVFGSKISVTTPDGRTLGFPDYYDEPSTFVKLLGQMSPAVEYSRQAWSFLNQRLGGLECDAAGKPLLRPVKPALFNFGGIVYDTFDECRAARRRYFEGVPKDFRLVEIRLFAYDWRCDLKEGAEALAASIRHLHEGDGPDCLKNLPDVDDQVAVAGHSTGGVIIRRALKEAGMQARISHAFFLNVPFRGAPKAMGVILTGKDPPGGGPLNRMIPFVDADSLRALALGMPIVYHLAPSAAYPEQVAFTPNRPKGAPPSIEDDKRDLVTTAIDSGFLPPPRFIKASGLTAEQRAQLAATADKWHEYWGEAFERFRAQEVYAAVYPAGYAKYDGWFSRELRSRSLDDQFNARFIGGWNDKLAEDAKVFHEESEAEARSGRWAKKAYIFYSVAKAPTMLSVHYERLGGNEYPDLVALLDAERMPLWKFTDGEAIPPRREEEFTLSGDRTVPAPVVHQWNAVPRSYRRTVWRLHGENRPFAGDGTVPTRSLLGFGGPAQVVKPVPGGPDHTTAPNEEYVWDMIMRILQDTATPDDFDEKADPITGSIH